MNKKGFTLIELLAVIIILAILTLIVAPIVSNVIESAKVASDLRSAEAYIKAGENYYAEAVLDSSKAAKIGKVNVLDELEVSARKATGKLYVEEDGSISMALLIRGKCYTKLASQSIKDITVTDGDNCGELPSVAFSEVRIPNSGTYARESTLTIPVPSGMSLYVKVNKSKEINSGTVSEKCNEDLSNCEATTDTTLEVNTWYKVSSSNIAIRTEEDLIITTKQVSGRDSKLDEYKVENIDSAPSVPIISGGRAAESSEPVIISIDTESTSLSGIEKYQYCTSETNSYTSCTWIDMSSLSQKFLNRGMYNVFVKAISNVGLESISIPQVINIISPWSITKGTGNISTSPEIGDIIVIDTERFFIYGFEDIDSDGVNEVKAIAEYNLEVGNNTNSSNPATTEHNLQSSLAVGWKSTGTPYYATVKFSDNNHKGINYSSYIGSYPQYYVDIYKIKLEEKNAIIKEARLITYNELVDLGCVYNVSSGGTCTSAPNFISNTTYWTGTSSAPDGIWSVGSDSNFWGAPYSASTDLGVRPIIIIESTEI